MKSYCELPTRRPRTRIHSTVSGSVTGPNVIVRRAPSTCRPSICVTIDTTLPDAQACGAHAVGYATGSATSSLAKPQNSSGARLSGNV